MNHDYFSVLRSLANKHDVDIDHDEKIIEVLSNNAKNKKNDLGNGSWGKISYLRKYCGYKLFKVRSFS